MRVRCDTRRQLSSKHYEMVKLDGLILSERIAEILFSLNQRRYSVLRELS